MRTRQADTIGVNTITTRREFRIRTVAFGLFLLGLVVALFVGVGLVGLIEGHGWHLPRPQWRGLSTGDGPLIGATPKGKTARQLHFPLTVLWPNNVAVGWAALAGLVPLVLWIRLVVAPVMRRLRVDPRHTGLANSAAIRKAFGASTVRKTGKFTFPKLSAFRRFLLPTSSFGFALGHPQLPAGKGTLWANWEQRVRIVARPGWGKTWRLLIPIIRDLPGAAVITSIEAEIFTATVEARARRRDPARWAWLRWFRGSLRTAWDYPVVVADMTAPEKRFAAGYPQVRWNPILGCEDFAIATRRAEALVSGVDSGSEDSSGTDAFFRKSASQVLGAWLHAAAFDPRVEVDDLVEWLRDGDTATPTGILQAHRSVADATALMNMLKHLDPKAGKTTSGVERYLTFAISSFGSGDGRILCGDRDGDQFDMEDLIRHDGTLYLLADQSRIEQARPLLSLFASEMFLAAESVAQAQRGKRRLNRPFIGVLDEMLHGVRVSILPYVGAGQRKYGIGYVYACQSAGQEEQAYGTKTAEELRAVAGLSIYGGIDASSADEITRRAGSTSVVTAQRGNEGHHSEGVQMLETFTVGDQQQLADGESVLVGRGVSPFLAYTPAVFERRGLRKQVGREVSAVERKVASARDVELARLRATKVTGTSGYRPGDRDRIRLAKEAS